MKIFAIGTSVVPLGTGKYGGIEKLCYNYTDALARAGHEITIAAPIGSKVPNGVSLIETVKIPEEQDRDDIAMQKIVLANPKFEMLHDFSHNQLVSRNSASNMPSVSMCWNPIIYKYQVAAFNILCVSDWQRQRFERLYKQKAMVGATGFLDTTVFKPDDSVKRSDRFLFLGKLSVEKGPDIAIQYAKELDVPIDIVGGLIPTEAASTFVRVLQNEAGDNDKWKIHYNVSEEEKIRFLQTCKAIIYPVRQDEAHWLAGIEAWCCDTPTIVFDKGAMRTLMPASFLAKTKTEFLEKMRNVGMTDEIREWGKVSREQYGVDFCVKFYIDLYQKVRDGLRW